MIAVTRLLQPHEIMSLRSIRLSLELTGERMLRTFLCVAIAAINSGAASGQSWRDTKNTASDQVYTSEARRTFYCGCEYTSHEDTDGSGDVDDVNACGYDRGANDQARANRIEWEHVVPASLMPARQFACWDGPDGERDRCERENPEAQAMIFELHNLVPSVGQANGDRDNHRYADLDDDISDYGTCEIENSRSDNQFEPPDCKKGDVARIWLFMEAEHGVWIPTDERAMFIEWMDADPISPWEAERERRIFDLTGVRNQYVAGGGTDPAGACSWEPSTQTTP